MSREVLGAPGMRTSTQIHSHSSSMTASRVLYRLGGCTRSHTQAQTPFRSIPSESCPSLCSLRQSFLVPPSWLSNPICPLVLRLLLHSWMLEPALLWCETTSSSPFNTAAHTQALDRLLDPGCGPNMYTQRHHPLARLTLTLLPKTVLQHHHCFANHALNSSTAFVTAC